MNNGTTKARKTIKYNPSIIYQRTYHSPVNPEGRIKLDGLTKVTPAVAYQTHCDNRHKSIQKMPISVDNKTNYAKSSIYIHLQEDQFRHFNHCLRWSAYIYRIHLARRKGSYTNKILKFYPEETARKL